MNRNPSTSITPPNTATKGAVPHVNPVAWKALFSDARSAFGPEIAGLTCATKDRAFFQITGDSTHYSIQLSDSERSLFHY